MTRGRSGTTLRSGSPGHATRLATDLENVVQAFLGRLSSCWRMGRCRPPGRSFCRGVVSHGFFGGRDGTRATPRKQSRPRVWVASEAAKIARGPDCDSRPSQLCPKRRSNRQWSSALMEGAGGEEVRGKGGSLSRTKTAFWTRLATLDVLRVMASKVGLNGRLHWCKCRSGCCRRTTAGNGG